MQSVFVCLNFDELSFCFDVFSHPSTRLTTPVDDVIGSRATNVAREQSPHCLTKQFERNFLVVHTNCV